jgi:alcohol dehydrogenase class IV
MEHPLTYLAPRATWFGQRQMQSIDFALKEQLSIPSGAVLLAVDQAIADSEAIVSMLETLRKASFQPTVRTDFGPELQSTQVDNAAETAREIQAVAVIGIGGGSVLDAAKMISLLVTNPGESTDWFGEVVPPTKPAPLVLAPTTVGTGAEVSRISMISHDGEKRIASSITFVPDLAILDEDLVVSLPKSVVASTAMDAVAHSVESIMSSTSNQLTEEAATRAIRLVMENVETAQQGDTQARGQLLYAAHLGGLALNSGVVLGHSLAYAINHEKPLPHGTTSGLALPYTIAYNQRLDSRKAHLIASEILGEDTSDLRAAAEKILQLLRTLGQPSTLNEAGVPLDVEDSMATRAVELYPRPTNPEPMESARVARLVKAMRDGDLDAAFGLYSEESN